MGRYDTPQSAGARFVLILTAWITGPWAAAPAVDETSSLHPDVAYTCMIRFTLDE